MKKTIIRIILISNYLLNGCTFNFDTYPNNSQSIKKKATVIENLQDGNYRFCSDPASTENINGFDGEAWCFEFQKKDINIVGTYSYQAPKDTAYICLEGVVKDNLVNGVGYEIAQYGETKPDIEQVKIGILRNTWFMSKKGYWDNHISEGEEVNNLKVSSPSFYKLIEPERPGNNYWIWFRFNIAELNLSNFYQRRLRKYQFQGDFKEVIPVSQCIN